jgi:hypothetical protein
MAASSPAAPFASLRAIEISESPTPSPRNKITFLDAPA